ncbi:alpha/beta fold hydrolase [soil metagenome]
MRDAEMTQEFKEARLAQGAVRYREMGEGVPIVFVHGILVNSALWREVIPPLSQHFRCIAPDLPLGGHRLPMDSNADLSPGGVAQIVADFMEALDLQDVTLVGNDTGGAICQIVVSRHPERLSRLVLTNCDSYEAFFPALLRPFHYGAKFLGRRFVDIVAWTLRTRFAQRALLKTVAIRRMDGAILDAYMEPLIQNPEVRRDLTKFLSQVSNRYTLDAARSFGDFERPMLIAWGENDIFFSSKLARRLQQDFPAATLEFVSVSRAFVPEDRPERLVDLIQDFMQAHGTVIPFRFVDGIMCACQRYTIHG